MKEKQISVRPRPVLLMVGTRPEAIKLLPVYRELKKQKVPTLLCAVGQHAELLDDVLRLFRVRPDYDFRIMKSNQDLFHVTESSLDKAKQLFKRVQPSIVLVQGDTTSAMASALAAFYLQIPLAHVEAGLRSGNLRGPFPEELNRRFISLLSSLHFAPTAHAASQLLEEGIDPDSVFCTGNTVVDALLSIRHRVAKGVLAVSSDLKRTLEEQQEKQRTMMLLTIHRRESFGQPLLSVFQAMKQALTDYPDLFILYPVHPNPQIRQALTSSGLASCPNILILPPLLYPDLIYALDAVDFVATDSGGLLEEAVSLRKQVLVLRNETDRPEASARLVGTDERKILASIRAVWESDSSKQPKQLPFGDGTASKQIVSILKNKGLC